MTQRTPTGNAAPTADVTAILTLHREGLLAGPALRSFQEAIDHAATHNVAVEPLVVLDRPDHLTRAMVDAHDHDLAGVLEIDAGDPALARNHGVARANGNFVTFLDGDDLWGFNWIEAAFRFCRPHPTPVVAHSQVNLVFGEASALWWHADSTDPATDIDYQRVANYWDAMCFTARAIALAHPFAANNLEAGFGHEDWHWNNVTLAAGIAHRPVPGTIHMKRRRANSQMDRCEKGGAVPYPSSLSRY